MQLNELQVYSKLTVVPAIGYYSKCHLICTISRVYEMCCDTCNNSTTRESKRVLVIDDSDPEEGACTSLGISKVSWKIYNSIREDRVI